MNNRQSFLSNILNGLLGQLYNTIYNNRWLIIRVGTCAIIITIGLSLKFHSTIINYFLKLVSGYSLLFIVYVLAWIICLDFKVNVEQIENPYYKVKLSKPPKYKYTIVWGIILIVMGIAAMYYSDKYRKHYAFLCETFFVDTTDRVYHYEYCDDCENYQEAEDLQHQIKEMKGYEIEDGYKLCEDCKEVMEEWEDMEIEARARR